MLIGIDEVGRGSLAGPLVVGVVGLKDKIDGLKDSKQLSKAARERLAENIYQQAYIATLGWVWPHEIDEIGLTLSTTLAIERALSLVTKPFDAILVDGKYNYLAANKLARTQVRADSNVPAVSAASIIAKVARDNYMTAMSSYFPFYNFASHVGYATLKHIKAIDLNGPCVMHRLSFAPLSEKTFDVG